jgi:hypothetical protein
LTLNSQHYTNTVSGNSTAVTITAAGLQALTNGQTYTMTADVNDAAGNAAAQVTSSEFTVDTTAPNNPTIEFESGSSGDTFNSNKRIVHFTFDEQPSGFTKNSITVSSNATKDNAFVANYTPYNNMDGTFTYKLGVTSNAQNETVTINVGANAFQDNVGNKNTSATANVTFIWDPLPNIALFQVLDDNIHINDVTNGGTELTIVFNEPVYGDNSQTPLTVSDFSSMLTLDTSILGNINTVITSDNQIFHVKLNNIMPNIEYDTTIKVGNKSFNIYESNGDVFNINTLNISEIMSVDTQAPTISSISSDWGTVLNSTEDDTTKTVNVVTSGVEDEQTLTVTLNGLKYTANVSGNKAAVPISAAGLQGLAHGSSHTMVASVSDAAGNDAAVSTLAFTVDTSSPSISSITPNWGSVLNSTDDDTGKRAYELPGGKE